MSKKANKIELVDLFCGDCGETYLFRLKNKDKELLLGLQDILRCLRFLEKTGAVQELPSSWWCGLRNQYLNTREWFK